MTKTKINAEVVADSLSPQGDRLTSLLITFPRIILAEVNTHRMLSKNTSSSRAIPFKKMVESVENDPFIPIAWQKHHSGMQGSEYFTEECMIGNENKPVKISKRKSLNYSAANQFKPLLQSWHTSRVNAIKTATQLHNMGVTKQLCNRLLEPFMWTTMLITGSKEGWDNFFELRCPAYEFKGNVYRSKKDVIESVHKPFRFKVSESEFIEYKDVFSDKRFWQKINKGQAEIHLMDLAEKIYDAMNESTPKQLKAGEWHIPFGDKLNKEKISELEDNFNHIDLHQWEIPVKISTAMAARTSYTVIGDEKEIDYERMIGLHDRLIAQNPPHSSPMEHCARAMSDEEYYASIKTTNYPLLIPRNKKDIEINGGFVNQELYPQHKQYGENIDRTMYGWCRNYRGFIQYRHLVEKYLIYKRPQYGTR